MTASTTIAVEDLAGVRVITLNRPARLNSFNEEMHLRVARSADRRRGHDGCRAVLLTGAGRGFCAGPGSLRPRARRGRQGTGPRPAPSRRFKSRWCGGPRRCPCPSSAPSTAWPREPAPMSRSPATSCSPARSAQLHPGLLQARPRAGFRRHLFPAAARRRSARDGRWRCSPTRAGRDGRGLGPDLEMRRRRQADGRRRMQLATHLRHAADAMASALTKRALDASLRQQLRRPARSRARPAARGRPHTRLCRGRARLLGKAQRRTSRAEEPDA